MTNWQLDLTSPDDVARQASAGDRVHSGLMPPRWLLARLDELLRPRGLTLVILGGKRGRDCRIARATILAHLSQVRALQASRDGKGPLADLLAEHGIEDAPAASGATGRPSQCVTPARARRPEGRKDTVRMGDLQKRVLHLLAGRGPLTPGEISLAIRAETADVSPSAISRATAKLLRRGLLHRDREYVCVTECGMDYHRGV